MISKEDKRDRMKFMIRRIDDSKAFLMSPEYYGPNNYKFIDGTLYILNSSEKVYVLANIALNDLLSDEFTVYIYE